MMLTYDWMNDSDIREVWAENAFYCSVEYIRGTRTQQEQIIGGMDWFLSLYYGKKDLIPKVQQAIVSTVLTGQAIFSLEDHSNRAEYVINQFIFLAAQTMKPLVLQNDKILITSERQCFYDALEDKRFYHLQPEEIFMKAKFVSEFIKETLIEMDK